MIPEWGLCCNYWKQENQADLANNSNGVFLDQTLRRPLTPGCTAFAKNSAPLSLNSSSPHPLFCGLDLVCSLCGYAGIVWFIPLCFHCLVCSLTPCFSTAGIEVHWCLLLLCCQMPSWANLPASYHLYLANPSQMGICTAGKSMQGRQHGHMQTEEPPWPAARSLQKGRHLAWGFILCLNLILGAWGLILFFLFLYLEHPWSVLGAFSILLVLFIWAKNIFLLYICQV